jgi:hypothetical protein
LKKLQSSEPLHAKLNPISCLFGSRVAQNPVFLLAGALLYNEKLCQRVTLFWIGLRNDEILCLQAATQRTIDASPAFMECGSVKKIAV